MYTYSHFNLIPTASEIIYIGKINLQRVNKKLCDHAIRCSTHRFYKSQNLEVVTRELRYYFFGTTFAGYKQRYKYLKHQKVALGKLKVEEIASNTKPLNKIRGDRCKVRHEVSKKCRSENVSL